jgi:hypothetical protein
MEQEKAVTAIRTIASVIRDFENTTCRGLRQGKKHSPFPKRLRGGLQREPADSANPVTEVTHETYMMHTVYVDRERGVTSQVQCCRDDAALLRVAQFNCG